jgi:DNA-directed RNA polymerase beta' subunit
MESKIKEILEDMDKISKFSEEEYENYQSEYNLKNGENSYNLMIKELDKIFQECFEKFKYITNQDILEENKESHIFTLIEEHKEIYGKNFHEGFILYVMENTGGQ